ncbi:MAG: LytR/AlgR family response regulator transcription factor [Agriterribacter sp.]
MQTAFLVRVNGKLKYIPFEDVLFIIAKDKYCEIITVKKKKWLTRATMNYIEKKLPKNLFVRVHRSHIISLNKIDWLDYNIVEIGEYKLAVNKQGHEAITEKTLVLCPEFDKK